MTAGLYLRHKKSVIICASSLLPYSLRQGTLLTRQSSHTQTSYSTNHLKISDLYGRLYMLRILIEIILIKFVILSKQLLTIQSFCTQHT